MSPPPSVFWQMTITSLEDQQSLVTGAAAKMSHLSIYPRRSVTWLTVGVTGTIRLLKVVVALQKNLIVWQWGRLLRKNHKPEDDSENGPGRVWWEFRPVLSGAGLTDARCKYLTE